MRHRKVGKKLDRTAGSRQLLRRQLAINFIRHGRMTTTEAKAAHVRPFIERLLTVSRTDTLSNRRTLLSALQNEPAVKKLLSDLGPKMKARPGGYTRTIPVRQRRGDGAKLVLISFVTE